MRAFSETELERMRQAQEAGMMDTCDVLEFREGVADGYGMPAQSWEPRVLGESLACGLDVKAHREVWNGTQVAVSDAALRLPIATTIDKRDRIRITHRHGEALASPEVYEIIGDPRRGPSGLVLNLRRTK